jgi:hypothetical protein
VRDTVVDIAALSKSFEMAQRTPIRAPNPGDSREHYEFALQQYGKAIDLMRTLSTNSSISEKLY